MFATVFSGVDEAGAALLSSAEAGMRYRKTVLAPGGTGDIMAHLTRFLGGRAPNQRAFLNANGIAT